MNTNNEIRKWLRETRGIRGVKDCHIAHAKELSGLRVKPAWNRQGDVRVIPCPSDKLPHIKAALKHLGKL